MNNRGRWRIGALASAIALLGSMASLDAHALALGRINVQSALGESLRAEIDITDVSAQEASSLRVGVASAEVFKAAGLEYTSAVTGLEVKLQRRADGRLYLRLSTNRAISEPFVDLILEAKWPSGRVTRDYTMLIDPPNLRANSANMATPTAPQLSRAPVVSMLGLRARENTPAARPEVAARAAAIKIPAAKKTSGDATQITVKAGDTASKIAAQNKPASVSLDQMLVALLRRNPDAFAGGNINVIKSGAVLDIPDIKAVNALTPAEATHTLIAQSKDFNNFRRKLAEGVSATQTDRANRQIDGKVQARVEDRAQANTTPDKLTLSKGAIQGKAASGAEINASGDSSSRVAELSKNISDLNKLGASPASTSVPATLGGTAPVLGSSSPLPALTTSDAAAPNDASALVTKGSEVPIAPVSEPVPTAALAPAAIKPPVLIAPPVPAPGLVDQILDNSLLLGAGGLLVLLAGLGFARYRKNKKMGHVDSSFLDSRLQPDSFFGASGGRRIDTNEPNAGASSIAYTPSQLDTAGDVDPVAEADVYLAYGRDQQAEEILREAMRNHPTRVAIQTKLLEIYAKRRDIKSFESVALAVFKLTKGNGAEWAYITKLGLDLDPSSSLYQSSEGARSQLEGPASALQHLDVAVPLHSPATVPASAVDLDFDLSFNDIPDAPITSPAPLTAQISSFGSGISMPSAILNLDDLDLDLDFDNPPAAVITSASATPLVSPSAQATSPEIDFLSEGLNFTAEPFAPPPAPIAPAAPVTHSGMLEFDLNSLSLDLDPTIPAQISALTEPEEDPLEIKFLLAEEFRVLGDADGARSLADEVLAKARGPLKVKVQAFLNALS